MGPHDPILAPWTAYYTVTGSSAAALIGLMFVVITLIGDRERKLELSNDGVSVFSTPTVIHFAAALIVSASLCAPWHSLTGPAFIVVAVGIVGALYSGRALLRTRALGSYTPDAEDWLWYAIGPLGVYAVMAIAGFTFVPFGKPALFAGAGTVALLIVLGIRNAWDVVTYIAIFRGNDEN
jgi:hypothetical protein